MLGPPIRDGKDALEVNWLEITIRDANGKVTYCNSSITDLPVNANKVENLAAAGRARWKIGLGWVTGGDCRAAPAM